MPFKTPEPPSILAELRRRANLVHGISKDDEALELARMLLRILPNLESLVQYASYSSHGSVVGQTKALEAFVSAAGSLAIWLDQPIR
jgi:hypothetical protein